MSLCVERRRRCRFTVRWPVKIYVAKDTGGIEGLTENMSSKGFYCTVTSSALQGQIITCEIEVPSLASQERLKTYLHCEAVVLRVEPGVAPGRFGLACRIKDYFIQSRRIDGELNS